MKKEDMGIKEYLDQIPVYGEQKTEPLPLRSESSGSDLYSALGLGEPRSTADLMGVLVEATDILLHKKDYDGDGWERLQHAMETSKERIETLRSINPND